jgi:hypothetical protein
MKMTEIREKARQLGIRPKKRPKLELVRLIQRCEGFPDCHGRSYGHCMNLECCFRSDCLKVKT